MPYIVVEHFRDGDPRPVYSRFRDRGRLAPAGLTYVSSWVTEDLKHCYQIMECDDRALLDEWMRAWQDLVDFEAYPARFGSIQPANTLVSAALVGDEYLVEIEAEAQLR